MSELTRTRGLQHDALFFSDEQTLASSLVPFIREGLERDEVVFLSCTGHPVFALLAALFSDAPGVRFVDREGMSRPVAVLDHYQRIMDSELRRGVKAFRSAGFTDLNQSQGGWLEWLRYEAAVNRVFADYPCRTMCLWDLRRLPEDCVPAYRAAHTGIVGATGPEPNEGYVEPEELIGRPEHLLPPESVQAGRPDLEAEVGHDLRHLRLEVYPLVMSSELDSVKVDDFIKAVGGVVLNACKHGTGTARLRVWARPDRLVCTVTDRGAGIEDPFVGYAKPATRQPGDAPDGGGFGMWAARQLCDSLDYASGPDGFTVRLVSRG